MVSIIIQRKDSRGERREFCMVRGLVASRALVGREIEPWVIGKYLDTACHPRAVSVSRRVGL